MAMAAAAAGRGTPGAGGTGMSEAAAAATRRRGRQAEVQEVIDELAQETKRTTLLERVEEQLKGQPHVSRLVFGFGMTDDKKIQSAVEKKFLEWKEKQEKQSSAVMSGIMLFMGQSAVHFLEGPTEQLFAALHFFHSLSSDAKPAAVGQAAAPSSPRQELIGSVRVLHFTELHGVRVSTSWCSCTPGGKPTGAQGLVDDGNSSDLVFAVYRKFMLMCLKVKETFTGDDSDRSRLQSSYRRLSDLMPTIDEVNTLMGKSGADYYFTYAEFEKLFIAPFHLVLHSELLWPMPPALSY